MRRSNGILQPGFIILGRGRLLGGVRMHMLALAVRHGQVLVALRPAHKAGDRDDEDAHYVKQAVAHNPGHCSSARGW